MHSLYSEVQSKIKAKKSEAIEINNSFAFFFKRTSYAERTVCTAGIS